MAHQLQSDPAQLTAVLEMLCLSDTAQIKRGEKMLKPFLKNPGCILALVHQVQTSQNESVRLHAALLTKKRIVAAFESNHFDEQKQVEIRNLLLRLMTTEPHKGVRTALAGAVATLSQVVLAKGDWPELFSLLLALAQDPNENLRGLNYSLLEQMSESVPDKLKPHTNTLCQLLTMGCTDAVPTVAQAAMSATASLIRSLAGEDEVMGLKPVLTPMLTVMQQCIDRDEEDAVTEGLEIINECAEIEQPLLNDHLDVIVPFLVFQMNKEDLSSSIKQAAGQALISIIENRPKLLAKKNLVVPTLTMLMQLLSKESTGSGALFSFSQHESSRANCEDGDDDDESYESEVDAAKLVQMAIDTMAIHIPSKYFVDPALGLVAQGLQSQDPHMRKAGCAVLGVIAEGCRDSIRERLADIVPALLTVARDPEHVVRECACFALGQFSEYCQPEILTYHQTVIPVIFQALDDEHSSVKSVSCYVLEMFCESLQPETLRPFLNPLMQRLVTLLQNPTKLTQEMALTAIAATAVAAELDFLPFAETVCSLLMQMLFTTEPANFGLRGRSLECLGHIAIAVGKDNFARYFEAGMQSSISAIQLKDEALQEHSYVFFANAAKVMSNHMEPYLPHLVPHLLETIAVSEISPYNDSDEEEDEEDDEEEDDDEGARCILNVHEGFINSKKAAITALGALAENTKAAFAPYISKSIETLLTENIGAISSVHDGIRAEAIIILKDMMSSASAANGITSAPMKGQVIALPAQVSEICKICMNQCVTVINEDEDKLPVSQAIECIKGILETVGMACLMVPDNEGKNIATKLMETIYVLLTEKTPCQSRQKYDADDDEDDHDVVVMDAVSDLIGALAKASGAQFTGYFDHFKTPLFRFTNDSRSYTDRAMAIGCFAEVFQEIGPSSIKYKDLILPLIQKSLQDKMESVRRNSAFCLGVLVEACGAEAVPHFMQMLQWLHPLCLRKAEQMGSDCGGADVDNAISAVARMIKVSPDSVPLAQVIPAMIAALPLRSDTSEGPCVYSTLIQLLRSGNPAAAAFRPQLLTLMQASLSPESKDIDETKAIIRIYLQEQGL